MAEETHNSVKGAEKDATEIWCHYDLYAKLISIIKSIGWVAYDDVIIDKSSDGSIINAVTSLTGGPAHLFLFTNNQYQVQCILPMDGNKEKISINILAGKSNICVYKLSISFWKYEETCDFLHHMNIDITDGSKEVINHIISELRAVIIPWMECFNKGDYDGCFRVTREEH